MRGKDKTPIFRHFQLGITPAYAGKRTIEKFANTPDQDHPRLCGEKKSKSCAILNLPGSPPPMRGKAYENKGNSVTLRITHAYAGKSIIRFTHYI